MAAGGAQGAPNSQLTRPIAGAYEHEVYEIYASDDQKEEGARLEQEEHGSNRSDIICLEGRHHRVAAILRIQRRKGIFSSCCCVIGGDLRPCLGDRRAVPQPRDHHHPVFVTPEHSAFILIGGQGCVDGRPN